MIAETRHIEIAYASDGGRDLHAVCRDENPWVTACAKRFHSSHDPTGDETVTCVDCKRVIAATQKINAMKRSKYRGS